MWVTGLGDEHASREIATADRATACDDPVIVAAVLAGVLVVVVIVAAVRLRARDSAPRPPRPSATG